RDPRAWTPFLGTASDKGASTLQPRNPGHATPEVVVENSLALASTRGPSRRDDLSKSCAISSPPRKECGYVRGRRLTSARDEEIRATREMALAIARGLAGKAKPCTSSVAGTTRLAPWLLQLGRISFRWTEPARDAAGRSMVPTDAPGRAVARMLQQWP